MLCCVPLCPSSSRKNRNVEFYPFPTRKKFKDEWIRVLKDTEVYTKIVGEKGSSVLSNMFLCSRHFTEDDFQSCLIMDQKTRRQHNCSGVITTEVDPLRSLKEDAVPSVFMKKAVKGSNNSNGENRQRKKRRTLSEIAGSTSVALRSGNAEVPFATVALCMKEAVSSFTKALQEFEMEKEHHARRSQVLIAEPPEPPAVIDVQSMRDSQTPGTTTSPIASEDTTNDIVEQEKNAGNLCKNDSPLVTAGRLTRMALSRMSRELQSTQLVVPLELEDKKEFSTSSHPDNIQFNSPSQIDMKPIKKRVARRSAPAEIFGATETNKLELRTKLRSGRPRGISHGFQSPQIDVSLELEEDTTEVSQSGDIKLPSLSSSQNGKTSAKPSSRGPEHSKMAILKTTTKLKTKLKRGRPSIASQSQLKVKIKKAKVRSQAASTSATSNKTKYSGFKEGKSAGFFIPTLQPRYVGDESERKQAGFVQSMFSHAISKVFSEAVSKPKRSPRSAPIARKRKLVGVTKDEKMSSDEDGESNKLPWEDIMGNNFKKMQYHYDSCSNTIRLPNQRILNMEVESDGENDNDSTADPLEVYQNSYPTSRIVKVDTGEVLEDEYGTPLLNGFGIEMDSSHNGLTEEERSADGKELIITPDSCEYQSDASEGTDDNYYALIPTIEVNDGDCDDNNFDDQSSSSKIVKTESDSPAIADFADIKTEADDLGD